LEERIKQAKITAIIDRETYAKLKAKLALQDKTIREWIIQKIKEEVEKP
jgi:predicted HicB family RNase H-like nuclease